MGIIGGGILGLALAELIQNQGHRVTVLEAAPDLGGLASAWKLGDITWDRFYHVILLSDLHTRSLVESLRLNDDFHAVETKTGFYTNGKLFSMSNSWEFLKFPPLGLLSKLRLGLTIFHASRVKDWKALEQIPVEQWLRKWSGNKTTEKIWLPLLRAKLGESYRQASAAFIWATIARMYAARRSGLKKEMFGYVRGGYQHIIERFAEQLRTHEVSIYTGTPVKCIGSDEGGPIVQLATGDDMRFDRVICTAVPPIAAKLMPGLTALEQDRLLEIPYQGIVCASLLLKQPLDRFYVTNITEPDIPFTAVIETSALVDRKEFNGNCLVYLPKYVAPNDPLFDESDDSIRARFLSALKRMYPHFQEEDVLAFRVARVKYVFAIPTIGYSERVPSYQTSMPGVYMVNSSQIVNGTLNVNETLHLAENAFAEIMNPRIAK